MGHLDISDVGFVLPDGRPLLAGVDLRVGEADPRAPYQLWSWARLFPGTQTPSTAQPAVGSPEVAPDQLAVPPAEVLPRYADVLTQGDASPHAATFAPDPLRAGILATRDAFVGVVQGNGTLTETYAPAEGPHVVSTADGGAIVVGTVQTVTTIALQDSTLTIGDQTAVLLGKDVVASNLAITWLSVVAFAVPPAGSTEPVRVLGAEHSRTQVTGG